MANSVHQPNLINKLIKDNLFSKNSLRSIAAANVRVKEQFSRTVQNIEKEREAKAYEIKLNKKFFRRREQHLIRNGRENNADDAKVSDETSSSPDSTSSPPENKKAEEPDATQVKPTTQLLSKPKLATRLASIEENVDCIPRLPPASFSQSRRSVDATRSDSLKIAGRSRVYLNSRRVSKQNLEDELELKHLVLRLHRSDASVTDPELMTENEKKIYNFLQKTFKPTNNTSRKYSFKAPSDELSRYHNRRVSRVYADCRLSDRLSLTLSEMLSERGDQERRRRHTDYVPLKLPPIYKNKPLRLQDQKLRKQGRGSVDLRGCLTSADWRSLERCRYLRPPVQRFTTDSSSESDEDDFL